MKGVGINLNITSKGLGLTSGPSDIGLMDNIYSLTQGLSMRNWAKEEAEALNEKGLNGNSFYEGIGYNYTYGDSLNLLTLERLKNGFDSYEFGEIRNDKGELARGLTTADKEGKRKIRFGSLESGTEFAVDLAHESWRDGYTNIGSYETVSSVISHTKMANALMKEHGRNVFSNRADLQFEADIYEKYDTIGLATYAAEAYDSSADYWKRIAVTTETGATAYKIIPDGRMGLYDENDELIRKSIFETYDDNGNVTSTMTSEQAGGMSRKWMMINSLGMHMGMLPSFTDSQDFLDFRMNINEPYNNLSDAVGGMIGDTGLVWNSNTDNFIPNRNMFRTNFNPMAFGVQTNSFVNTLINTQTGAGVSTVTMPGQRTIHTLNIYDENNNVAGQISSIFGIGEQRTDIYQIENMSPDTHRMNAGTFLMTQDGIMTDESGFAMGWGMTSTMPDVERFNEEHPAISSGVYPYIKNHHPIVSLREGINILDNDAFGNLNEISNNLEFANNEYTNNRINEEQWANLIVEDTGEYRDNFPAYFYNANNEIVDATTDLINAHGTFANIFTTTNSINNVNNYDAGSDGCQTLYGAISWNTENNINIYSDYMNLFDDYSYGFYHIYRPFGDTR